MLFRDKWNHYTVQQWRSQEFCSGGASHWRRQGSIFSYFAQRSFWCYSSVSGLLQQDISEISSTGRHRTFEIYIKHQQKIWASLCRRGHDLFGLILAALLLCSKQTQRHFSSVLSYIKKYSISCLLHANACLPIVEQMHTGLYGALTCCAQQCLPNYALGYIPRIVSVRPRQVTFFLLILVTAVGGMPKPELCFLPGWLRWTLLPEEHCGNSLSCYGSTTQPSGYPLCQNLWCLAEKQFVSIVLYDVHLHLTFSFDCFKCLMLFANLHFSSQSSCVMETNCSSCRCIVSVFASHQYCFCVVKRKNVQATDQAHKK